VRKRKKLLKKKVDLVGHKEFVSAMMRRCYYMCNPLGEDGILKCVPSWSSNVKCRGDALTRVLDRYPDYKSIITSSNYGAPDRPMNVLPIEAFINEFELVALRAINNGRSNFTRAIKRNFFQPGANASTRSIAPPPDCCIYGDFQLAKGCLKNEVNCEVRCDVGNL
jgi:hypothetical protein